MKRHGLVLSLLVCLALAQGCATPRPGETASVSISGEMKQWHAVTLTFDGPASGELAGPNPFLDFRLDVTFSRDDRQYVVPGYYAADGQAADTGATEGNKWQVHFVPDELGQWTYAASFRKGPGIALDPNAPVYHCPGDQYTFGPPWGPDPGIPCWDYATTSYSMNLLAPSQGNYVPNLWGNRVNDINDPTLTVLYGDYTWEVLREPINVYRWGPQYWWHRNGRDNYSVNLGFVDGHCSYIRIIPGEQNSLHYRR